MIQKSTEHSKSNTKGKVYSNTSLPREVRKVSNKQHNLTPKGTRKKKKTKKQNPKLVEGKK